MIKALCFVMANLAFFLLSLTGIFLVLVLSFFIHSAQLTIFNNLISKNGAMALSLTLPKNLMGMGGLRKSGENHSMFVLHMVT